MRPAPSAGRQADTAKARASSYGPLRQRNPRFLPVGDAGRVKPMPAPTFCYVVMAHQPCGIERLVRRIRHLSPGARVLVRFEDEALFDSTALRAAGAIPLASRIAVRWGSWTLTEAMLEALRTARSLTSCAYHVVISGQDYPVRNLHAWEAEVADSGVDAILDPIVDHPEDYRYRWSIITPPIPRHPLVQRGSRHLAWRVGTVTKPVLQILPRFVEGDRRWIVGVARPWVRPPHGMAITKCSQWMTLSDFAAERLLETDRARPELRRFFRTVRISDESYIQSVLHALPDVRVRHGETTVKRFAPGASSPDWLDVPTLQAIAAASPAPFARKLPPDVSTEVVDVADRFAEQDLAARVLTVS